MAHNADEPSVALSLVAVGQEGQGKPSPEPSNKLLRKDYTRVKNAALILETLFEKGSNSKNRTLLHTFNSTTSSGPVVDELIEIGAIDVLPLKRSGTKWISISPKGRNIVKHWRRFIAAFNGGKEKWE